MTVHEQVLESMQVMAERFAADGVILDMPPSSTVTLSTRYCEIDYGRMLAAEIKFDPRFTNPLKIFQGGFLCAAIDDVFGPLTYMAAERPVLTIEMSTTFVRPFSAKDESVIIKAEIVSKSKSLLVLRGEVKTKAGKLIAVATNQSLIVTGNLRR
ncbi:MAG: PaaI family thioesterase [Bdellovibrionota bacterium]